MKSSLGSVGITVLIVIGCSSDPIETTIPLHEAALSRTYVLTGCGLPPVKQPPCTIFSTGSTSIVIDSSSVTFTDDGDAHFKKATRTRFNGCYMAAPPSNDCSVYDTTVTNQLFGYTIGTNGIVVPGVGADFITGVATPFGGGEALPARVPRSWQGPDSLLLLHGGGSWMGHLSVYKPVDLAPSGTAK
jgi:hypothetical protein